MQNTEIPDFTGDDETVLGATSDGRLAIFFELFDEDYKVKDFLGFIADEGKWNGIEPERVGANCGLGHRWLKRKANKGG